MLRGFERRDPRAYYRHMSACPFTSHPRLPIRLLYKSISRCLSRFMKEQVERQQKSGTYLSFFSSSGVDRTPGNTWPGVSTRFKIFSWISAGKSWYLMLPVTYTSSSVIRLSAWKPISKEHCTDFCAWRSRGLGHWSFVILYRACTACLMTVPQSTWSSLLQILDWENSGWFSLLSIAEQKSVSMMTTLLFYAWLAPFRLTSRILAIFGKSGPMLLW